MSATPSTGGMDAGSVFRPNTTKKMAANRSRRGSSTRAAFSAVAPEMAMPSRNAPTAAETCSAEAIPATSSAAPMSVRRNTSRSLLSTTAETTFPHRRAMTRTRVTTSSETPTVPTPAAIAGSASRAITGPNTAMSSTYVVARAASSPSTAPEATARPAMTMENSPRATSAVPARARPSRPIP